MVMGYSMFSMMTLRTELGQPCCWGRAESIGEDPVAVVPEGDAPPDITGDRRLTLAPVVGLTYMYSWTIKLYKEDGTCAYTA